MGFCNLSRPAGINGNATLGRLNCGARGTGRRRALAVVDRQRNRHRGRFGYADFLANEPIRRQPSE